ncbi:MAG TPA: response regulator [Clostridiaceae bacterium]|jgi:two-component system response regulator YesN|nr:response regulator [Clostridiaceae bacterium]
MTKVLIVDDEMLVRVGIKSLIDWEKHGFEIVGFASDGKEALDVIKKTLPDIILTDIVMPGMDGIELIRQVRSRYPFISILVLSCYNDFSYVKEAMKLGAEDYLLKLSIKPDELVALLKETAIKNSKKQKNMNMSYLPAIYDTLIDEKQRAEAICLLIAGNPEGKKILREQNIMDFDMDTVESAVVVIKMHKKGQPDGSRRVLEDSVMNLAANVLKEITKVHIVKYRDSEFVAITSLRCGKNHLSIEDIEESCRDLTNRISNVLNIFISIGISDAFIGLDNVKNAYRNASIAVSMSFFRSPGCVFSYRTLHSDNTNSNKKYDRLKELEGRLYSRIRSIDYNSTKKLFEELFSLINRIKPSIDNCKQIILSLAGVVCDLLEERGVNINSIPIQKEMLYSTVSDIEFISDGKEWLESILNGYFEKIKDAGVQYRPEIKKLIDYIHENYPEDITLSWASNYVNISENHLSSLFKKETGKNFIKYLEECRIDKAAILLRETNLPSYEIAIRVGYDNINYFGRVFKKVTGKSPRKYRGDYRRFVQEKSE